jgi:hypothetical protein
LSHLLDRWFVGGTASTIWSKPNYGVEEWKLWILTCIF